MTLELAGLEVTLGGTTVLDGIDITIGEGETLAILGPSGSGKSTLLRSVAGLVPIASGSIRWADADLVGVPAHRRRFGVVFQSYALFEHLDVAGNVAYGLRMREVPKAERRTRVDEALALVGLGEYGRRQVDTLSGGERQRVALARALVVDPEVLLLDEPLGAIDVALKGRLLEDVGRLTEDRTTLYVTHDHDEALTVGDRVALLRDGRLVGIGTPESLWTRPPDVWSARFLGHPNVYADGGPFADGPCLVPEAAVSERGGWAATVVDRQFAGDGWRVTARTGETDLTYRSSHAPSVGDSVDLAVDTVIPLEA